MPSLNKIMVIGRVGRDPEMRYAPSGAAVTKFSVATNRSYTARDGNKVEETEWFSVEAWNRLAEIATQYVVKGGRVYIEGRLKSEPWIGKDGAPRSGNTIVVTDLLLLDSRGDGGGTREEANNGVGAQEPALEAEDLPF